MSDLPHWARRTLAQQAAYETGRRDEENDEVRSLLPRYADALEQACYIEGRDEMALEMDWSLNSEGC